MQAISGIFQKLTGRPNSPADKACERLQSPGKCSDTETSIATKGEKEFNAMNAEELRILKETVYDLIKDIGDPEKPQTLEELNVVCEEDVVVSQFSKDTLHVEITFVPTVPHCSLASLIGLCLRRKVSTLPDKHKLDILVKEGTHDTAEEINKQINDKERIAAAMENPNLRDMVDKCINYENEYG